MFPYSFVRVQCLSFLIVAGSVVAAAEPEALQREFFESKVRPLLVEHCYGCHSAEADRIEGGLRLDSAAAVAKGGDSGAAVQPHDAEASLLVEAVRYASFEMPPAGKLPDDAIAIIEKWIQDGAYWPPEESTAPAVEEVFDLATRKASHWVWQAPTRPDVPATEAGSTAVDALLAKARREAGIQPAPTIDRRRLARRISFDLTGLPPSPEAVQRFVEDSRPDARSRYIDRLLADPGVGVRWGRHWLDLVRFAESRGHEFDHDVPGAYHYRDYVVRALNVDLPYDQFATEHLAGDLVDPPRIDPATGGNESVLGTGFWHLGEWVHSPVDVAKDEADRYDNAIDVFSKTFLGLTVACARCHDHKFDAISARDYYALAGFLQSSSYRLIRFDADASNRKVATRLATINQRGQADVQQRISAALLDGLPTIERRIRQAVLGTDDVSLVASLYAAAKEDPNDLLWPLTQQQIARPIERVAAQDRLIDFSAVTPSQFLQNGYSYGDRPVRPGDILWTLSTENPIEGIADKAVVRRDPIWTGLENEAPPRTNFKNKIVEWKRAGAVYRTPTFTIEEDALAYRVRGKGRAFLCVGSHRLVFGPLHGNTVKDFDISGRPAWISQNVARYRGQRAHLEFEPQGDSPLEIFAMVHGEAPDDVAFATVAAGDADEAIEAFLATLQDALRWWVSDDRDSVEPAVAAFYAQHVQWMWKHRVALLGDEAARIGLDRAAEVVAQRTRAGAEIAWHSRVAPALMDGSGENQPFYIRGNSSRPADVVPRRFLEAMGGEAARTDAGSGRLLLARQMTARSNPVFDRVIVNRIWHHLFGTGLVPTPDDFGVLGQRPTQQAVLDCLAVDFRQYDRSLKRTMRELMLSDTYARDSIANPASAKADPTNVTWHYRPVRRLEGEAIRDTLLYLAGNLDRTVGGPSVPVHLTPFMDGRGRPKQSGPADGLGRRSIYMEIRRNFLSPFMLAFDTPSPFSAMGRRNRSNVPAQALILQNNPFVQRQAIDWVTRSADAGSDAGRVARLYRDAFGREPTAEERSAALQFVAGGDDARWAALAHVLINIKEFIFIY